MAEKIQRSEALVQEVLHLPDDELDRLRWMLSRRTYRGPLAGDSMMSYVMEPASSRKKAALLLLSGDGVTIGGSETIDLNARGHLATLSEHPSLALHNGARYVIIGVHHMTVSPAASGPVVLSHNWEVTPVNLPLGDIVRDANGEPATEQSIRVKVRAFRLDGTDTMCFYHWMCVLQLGARWTLPS
jgi:hypothetical protein